MTEEDVVKIIQKELRKYHHLNLELENKWIEVSDFNAESKINEGDDRFIKEKHIMRAYQNKKGEIKSFVLTGITKDDITLINIAKVNHGKWFNYKKGWVFSTKHKETLEKMGCMWCDEILTYGEVNHNYFKINKNK